MLSRDPVTTPSSVEVRHALLKIVILAVAGVLITAAHLSSVHESEGIPIQCALPSGPQVLFP